MLALHGVLIKGINLLSVLKVAAGLFIELTKRILLLPAIKNTNDALRIILYSFLHFFFFKLLGQCFATAWFSISMQTC